MTDKPVSPTPTARPKGRLSIRATPMPAEANPIGTIFGGWVLAQMDLAGGNHAVLRAQGAVTTVAVEGMEFHLPVMVGDEFSCYTEVVRVGRTSIAVRVEAWVRRNCVDLVPIMVTSAVFTFVALDEHGKKRPVPPEPAETPQ